MENKKLEKVSFISAFITMLIAILWTAQIAPVLKISIYKEQYLAVFLAFSLLLIFIKKPMRKNGRVGGWLNIAMGIVAFSAVLYLSFNYQQIQLDFAYGGIKLLILSIVIFISVLEALRRTTGYVILGVVAFFFIFALFAHKIPMPLTGRENSINKLITYLALDPNSILGMPLSVIARTVVVFIFYGHVLMLIGGGEFFIDLSMSGVGNKRGGAAKIAIVSSALMGSISGSAVSNVASTGIMTIPLMQKAGFKSKTAAAIEAVASTGGQITPPIMGAAAFIMATFLQIPYKTVVIASIVPAALYYFAIFIQVDLMATRDNLKTDFMDLPLLRDVIKNGWPIFIPFIVLFACLFYFNITPELSALYSVVCLFIIGLIKPYKRDRINFRQMLPAFSSTIYSMLGLVPIVAAAGVIIGLLNISGGGFTISIALSQLANGNLWITLVISAFLCIILGMGMPTSGVYVLLSALLGPAIVEVGVFPLAAHMFLLYFGMMSMITPPIALASFTASTISGSEKLETGIESMKLGWVAYIVPVLFFFSPTLLLEGQTLEIIVDILTTGLGVFSISVSFIGYLTTPITKLYRMILGVAGVLLLIPLKALDMNYVFPLVFVLINIFIFLVIKLRKQFVHN
ncbi:MAG: TRAP transporter fused permease subunit [Spirochaetales bacterium]|uniref:TRAP transporter fused permease subunit n=1 Tax=Candidatus Thalassospirochaeta sargassi TaxID=3119039 RepID=A0AAJ1MJ38_9SPIO|nr:TRAP transporter fused permease subunit [Spirochaetales bacterium]